MLIALAHPYKLSDGEIEACRTRLSLSQPFETAALTVSAPRPLSQLPDHQGVRLHRRPARRSPEHQECEAPPALPPPGAAAWRRMIARSRACAAAFAIQKRSLITMQQLVLDRAARARTSCRSPLPASLLRTSAGQLRCRLLRFTLRLHA